METNCTITGITKLQLKRPTKLNQKVEKKVTATSDEKLDEAVKHGKWFEDAHINKAIKMIQNQFPSLTRFHNCLLGQNLSFPVTNEAFIQVLRVEGNHWIAIEHISSDCVNIYDSVHIQFSVY